MQKIKLLKVIPKTEDFHLESKIDKICLTAIESGQLVIYYKGPGNSMLKAHIKRIYPKAEFESCWVYADDLRDNTAKVKVNSLGFLRFETEISGELTDLYKEGYPGPKGKTILTTWIKKKDLLDYLVEKEVHLTMQVSWQNIRGTLYEISTTSEREKVIYFPQYLLEKSKDMLPNPKEIRSYDKEAWKERGEIILLTKSGDTITFD